MELKLGGKRVLVAGGNSGLGAAIAKTFAAEGDAVGINYIAGSEAANALVDRFTSSGGKALCLLADVGDPKAVEAMFAAIDDAWASLIS